MCAYKESLYLEECILSIMNQKVKSNILIATSTPNKYIYDIANRYNIEVVVNDGEGGIANDWNFAFSCAKTELVTLAHQDDIYLENYLSDALNYINNTKNTIIYFSNYDELRNGKPEKSNKLLFIKRVMLLPLCIRAFQKSRFWKRSVISFGNPICCPSVLYVRKNIPDKLFRVGFRSNVDWEAWELLSKNDGSFVYNPHVGMYHRIHKESETTATINDKARKNEDYEIFCKFWPRRIAKKLSKVYSKSEKSNKIE